MEQTINNRAQAIRAVILDYINQQLHEKTKGLECSSEDYVKQHAKHQPALWLDQIVKKLSALQVVTHPLKMTHSKINIREASSFYCAPCQLPAHSFVSSYLLKNTGYSDDLTGSAAAFPAYTFLQVEFEGQSLLTLAVNKDLDFIAALHDDEAVARRWATSMASIYLPKTDGVATHALAKQVFWGCSDNLYPSSTFVVLAPLYSSVLSYELYKKITHDRYSDEASQIREAARLNKKHHGVAKSYRNLAILKLGGANTQNISRLNNVMAGQNYLLASLPPNWQLQQTRTPLNIRSIFAVFEQRPSSAASLNALKALVARPLLAGAKQHKQVDPLVHGVLDELYIFAAAYQALAPGWSADALCDLPLPQRYWLDPARALHDQAFADAWLHTEWDRALEQAFAGWLTRQLGHNESLLSHLSFPCWAGEIRFDSHWQRLVSNAFESAQQRLAESGRSWC